MSLKNYAHIALEYIMLVILIKISLYGNFLPKGSHRQKKVTKLRTFSVPPLAPLPASTDTYGGLFSKSAYQRLATFTKKNAYVTILGGT